jgi:hypothetical protein
MKVLLLPDNLFDYLQHVVRAHAAAGIDPEEGLAIYQLNQHVGQAQTVDISNLGKARIENLGPEGVALRFEPTEPESTEPENPEVPTTPPAGSC